MLGYKQCLAVFAVVALGACAGGIPNSGADAVDLNAAGNFEPGTVGHFKAIAGDRVLFAVDQSTLSPEATQILDSQAAWLVENLDFSATIEGHADEQGTREYNLALGARRASAVMSYLVSKGLPADRVGTITFGKERPLEICSSESCWSRNRRAVTVLTAGAQS